MDPGERVKALRKKRGLSQETLGAMIGFSQSKISKIENGDWDSLSDLRLIAAALGVPIQELVREDDESAGDVTREVRRADEGVNAYFFKAAILNRHEIY